MTFIGIDGIPNGWGAVYLNGDGDYRFAHAERAAELPGVPYERAMIDFAFCSRTITVMPPWLFSLLAQESPIE